MAALWSRRAKGEWYERKAAALLKRRGYQIIERNFIARGGEIDIVALTGNCLVFVEVRQRGEGAKESAGESITAQKIRCIKRAAAQFITQRPAAKKLNIRFDVVLFDGGKPLHIEGAFT